MKHLLLLAGTVFFCTLSHAQTLIWESTDQVRPRDFDLNTVKAGGAIANEFSVLNLDNYDNDGQPDLVTIEEKEGGGVIQVIPANGKQIIFDTNFSSPEGPYKFLGFLDVPATNCSSEESTNQVLIGRLEGNRIIGILVGFCPYTAQGVRNMETRELDIGANYAFMGAYDLDKDDQAEILLFNTETRKVQLWSF
jgi:hypothetical protein